MIRLIVIVISIIFMFIAAFVALRLTKVTKYKLSWILISLGFLIMAIRRLIDFLQFIKYDTSERLSILNDWMAVLFSLFIAIGVIILPEIFNYMKRVEKTQKIAEKRVLNAIIRTEEKERQRFAKDLHDGLGPLLSTLKLSISALSQNITNPTEKEIIQNTDAIINEAIKSIKEISNNLSPYVLNHFGLASAIKSFTDKINESKQIEIIFQSNIFGRRFDNNTEVIIYRTFCELVSNTIKHAKAKKIIITLNFKDELIDLVYTDDGIGFDVNELQDVNSAGMGLQNIISRIKSINGTIDMSSNENKGFKAIIQVKVIKQYGENENNFG